MFDIIAQAQQVIGAWLQYNTDRPHQSLGRCTPPQRFTACPGADSLLPLDLTALTQRRTGPEWVTRRVAANRIVCVFWQQVSLGNGELVDVHVTDRLLEFWSGNDLLRTVIRVQQPHPRLTHRHRAA